MTTSTARVTTDRPAPYLKQLCKHFGHKTEVEFDDERGRIALGAGTCELAVEPDALELRASAASTEERERVEQVIGSHLERFGRRDGLSVTWEPTDQL